MVGQGGDEQVNMVRHNFQRNDFAFEFRNLLTYQDFTPFFDIVHQTLTAVLWTKNNVMSIPTHTKNQLTP